MLDQFNTAVKAWFDENFAAPTECQQAAWPAIKSGKHTLIAAPTGSGKTLAAFLTAIDDLVGTGIKHGLEDETHILYISPLKALSNDIQRNLQQPLDGIRNKLFEQSQPDVLIQAMVRTGDTPAASRAAMRKQAPHILVTTPESFYILLTSDSGRRMLKTVRSVIVDEIHAIAGSKRGSHLSLSLERLEILTQGGLTRIGLSATQKPINEIARFLLGNRPGKSECEIIDTGHARKLDLAIDLPDSPLEALLSGQAANEIYDKLAALINTHKTTLIFVNTRRMAERVARYLSERIGEERITSHHGSLAREQRLSAESRLKAGDLSALVATASLELGIDIGDIDLVCQIGSTRSIATLMQRVGRSGHSTLGLPKGRIFPTSRNELIECIALIRSIRQGELDRLTIPEKPLDVLAQQIVAMNACDDWQEDALFDSVRNAYPYRNLSRAEFDDVVEMLADGFSTRRGRRSAYIHRDGIHKRLRGRRGARLTAITCGGAIPDNAEYRVIEEPGGNYVGSVDEDFAMESLSGDIFQLGNTSWRVLRLEAGNLRVQDAQNQPPSIPFWFGEAPGRTIELSYAVSDLFKQVDQRCHQGESSSTSDWLCQQTGIAADPARQAVNYIAAARKTLGAVPSFDTLVVERFFDEAGGMHVILHAPFGSRVNRAWGLALRKCFCRSFNFELQAAANENAIILSVGESQSFPLPSITDYLSSTSVRKTLVQALLDAPMFTIRWRWNCTAALAVKRFQNGKKTPPYLVRMQAEDLITSVFPQQLACLENISGDREIPEHPLVQQTLTDCLTEAMDIERLVEVIQRIETGDMRVVTRDLVEPSPLAAEILTAQNYAFLDDTPAEERRTRAVTNRRWLDPASASDLGRLDPAAIARVRNESQIDAQTADELHDALCVSGFIEEHEETESTWGTLFEDLITQGRATRLTLKSPSESRTCSDPRSIWIAAEKIPLFAAIYPDIKPVPDFDLPEEYQRTNCEREDAIVEVLRARLDCIGPVTAKTLALSMDLTVNEIELALLTLENQGFLLRGQFNPDANDIEWCERRLLARIHRYTINALRKEIEPVCGADFMRFLFRWQHAYPKYRLHGPQAVTAVLEQLEGFETAAGAWEKEILRLRVDDYEFQWLDSQCQSGKFLWGRLSPTMAGGGPINSSPLAIVQRKRLGAWLDICRDTAPPLNATAQQVIDTLAAKGALFYDKLMDHCHLLESQLEAVLAELAGKGYITSDSYAGLRWMLAPEQKKQRSRRFRQQAGLEDAGRWTLLKKACGSETKDSPDSNPEDAIYYIAKVLLKRYGFMFRNLLNRENIAPPWRDLLSIYRRMEARGEIRGGRFVAGQFGEQFALPEAIEMLRAVHKNSGTDELIAISASDPLNLTGIVTPLDKVNALVNNRILYKNGVPLATHSANETRFSSHVDEKHKWAYKQQLNERKQTTQFHRFAR